MRVREIPAGVTTIYKKIQTIKSSSSPVHKLELILSPSEITAIEKKQKAQGRSGSKRFKLQVSESDQKVLFAL